ncbi:MAG TPA: phosphate ABC transporter substrate-binding protein PstS [Polyangiaceae bacterium]|jgi:phosphate transport system substrate-binding protein|nr:phosphate ABC transporter substrate-binding protein PstS [Polyangiaceae bacterium]
MILVSRRATGIVALFGFASLALGCGKKEAPASDTSGASSGAPSAAPAGGTITLQGSGASFPAPLYSRWFREFGDKNKDIRVNYQSTGSGAGIKAFTAGQTDFGASDAAMTDEEIKAANNNVVLLPMTAGNIVLAYNLDGVTELKLSREAYSGIFLGTIKKWDDPKIVAANPGVKLPKLDISVVHRSDGSGTTFVFTQHLAAINEKWKSGPGVGKSVEWPVGVGGAKNDGVAAQIHQTPGAIGYIEYAFAATTKQPTALLENKAGKYIAPSLKASATALEAVELPADLRAWVTDPAGDDSYPIVTYTWILAKKKYDDKAKADALKKVLKWCLTDGQKLSESLFYVPLPDKVSAEVLKAVDTIQ